MRKKYQKWLSAMAALTVLLPAGTGALPVQQQKAAAAGQLVAFPGAVGAGKYATGGRGGEVYHVTNLNDSGAGSLRDAVSKSGRIVVFDVSGTIELQGNILCQSNVTVAGQTAPGGSGVTLKNYKFGMSGDNIIVRYLSSRPGPDKCTSSGNDAWGGAKGSNSIIDHCSMGWTTDEQWGLYSNNEYYTVQYSVLGPANSWGGHVKGVHGFGIMMGKGYLTFDHNLIIHNVSRNFRGKTSGTETADFTNNIIYDWGYQTAYGTIGHLNYVNNTLKAGNSTTGGYHWMYVDSSTSPQNFKVFCAGNRLINKDGSFHAITGDNWAGVTVKESIGITKNDLYSASPFATTVGGENVSTASTCESAAAAYDHVISFAGNGIAPDKRTAIDQQCANETKNGTGQCSGTSAFDGSQEGLTKYNIKCGVTYQYPGAVTKKEITDADNDGMDDAWELARGLNPNDPADYKGDYCGQGYMNIEYYINDLTVDSFPAGVVQLSPTGSIAATPAFETIEAENYDAQEGIQTEDCPDGTENIGYVENGDYIMFRKVDFEDGANSISLRASGNPCTVEVYLDSLNSKPVASVPFEGTTGYSDYQTVLGRTKPITGQHNVYLKFTGGEGYLLNLNSFVFSKERIPVSGRYIYDLTVEDTAYPDAWSIQQDAAVGSTMFGDRDVTFVTLPEELTGAERLLTACDAKNSSGDLAHFYAAADCDLYILFDTRIEDAGKTPDWLGDFTRLSETASNSFDVTFALYKKALRAGDAVTLGNNNMNGNCVNYAVMLTGAPVVTTTTTTTTTTVTTTSATTSVSETTISTSESTSQISDTETTSAETETTLPDNASLRGDVNDDGAVDVKDAVLLARYVGGDTQASVNERGLRNAELDGKAGIGPMDLTTLLRALARLISL